MPKSAVVGVIGGGVIGLWTALTLAERGVPVVLLEKGRIGGEQSSRNLGWIRKMGRSLADLPLALAAEGLWEGAADRLGTDVGYRRAGIMYVVRSEDELARHADWLVSVADQHLGSRLVSDAEIRRLSPGGQTSWTGGIFTPSDGRAEPSLVAGALARAAMAKGATIIENCAVRGLSLAGGRVAGLVTERGEILCDHVVLAGGIWSRRFLGNIGIDLPALPLIASVLRTAPMDGPTDIAVGAPDFSFRKRADGGFTITQRGGFVAPIVVDSLLIGHRYLSTLREQWNNVRLSVGRELLDDIRLPRRWDVTAPSPFEQVRTMDPRVNTALNAEALANVAKAWPVFEQAEVVESWAGTIDVTPDGLPVISAVDSIPGLTVASGFSGHGFGTSPAAGHLAADIATGARPLVDSAPYRLSRFQA